MMVQLKKDGTMKKGRIRAADLKRYSQPSHGSTKYDFSKIVALKGKEGRDPRNIGRPAGIESRPSGSKKICLEALNENEGAVANVSQVTEIATCVDRLSCDEIYRNLLLEQNGFFHLDDQYKTYAMQDFDVEKSSLKPSLFHILQRDGCKFNDDLVWLWKCTCDKDRSEMISCFQGRMHITHHEFTDRWPICQHIKIGIAILDPFDSKSGIIPTINDAEVEVFNEFEGQSTTSGVENVVLLKNGLYCVWHADSYGIVSTSGREPKCLVCPHSHCPHTRTIESANITDTLTSEKKSYSKQCLSTLRIPFVSSTEMQNQYQMPDSDRFMFDRNNDVVLCPDELECEDCGTSLEVNVHECRVYLINQIVRGKVSRKNCPTCSRMYDFDGLSVCILNMRQFVICHEIMRRFMYYYLTGKTTIFSEYSVLCRTYKDAGHPNVPSYDDFKSAWYAFLDLLDINYNSSFLCPDCGPYPDSVVMDATSVSFRKHLMSWGELMSSIDRPGEPYDKKNPHKVKERTMFSATVRRILQQYATRGIESSGRNSLLEAIRSDTGSVAMSDLVEHILGESEVVDLRITVNATWKDFVKVLASPNPFSSFIPPDEDLVDTICKSFTKGEELFSSDLELNVIQEKVPVMFDILKKLKNKFPFKLFLECMTYMSSKVFHPFMQTPCPMELPDEQQNELEVYPCLPQLRKRGVYTADGGKRTMDDMCRKLAKGHPRLLPGVFTLYCQHGICYGFEVMRFCESPDVPFTLLRTRFPAAPKMVVYDNACSLHEYCLNRDPVFFKQTQFKVDSLHFKNHTACGPAYELKRYPAYAKFNSQVVEQANSRLQRLKASLSYMTQINFLNHCKFYIWGQNRDILKKAEYRKYVLKPQTRNIY